MKTTKINLIFVALLMLGLSANSFAQQQSSVPHAIKYQAVARNANGDIISNQNVSFRISIVQGSASGETVYQETQTVSTNQFGLANLSIGNGTVTTGVFDSIKWGNDSYFVKVEFDAKGGEDYTLMGVSQMLSVPYSLYAEHAKTADNVSTFPVKADLVATNSALPFSNPAKGMLVYNMDSAGISPANVVPGYYYNAGTPSSPNWVLLSSIDKSGSIDRIMAPGTNNTTYGGTVQGAAGANVTSSPQGNENTGFGVLAFGNNASTNPMGNYNTAVGFTALQNITGGSSNTAVGSGALYTNTTTNYNTAVGYNALYDNTGTNNVGLGVQALVDNTGNNNTATGTNASEDNTTGSDNTSSGFLALQSNQTGWSNTAIGVSALNANTAGYNTAVGSGSLAANTSGTPNTAIGYNALAANISGTNNVAVGDNAMGTGSPSFCTAVGSGALNGGAGNGSTAVGYNALTANAGGLNTAVGYMALASDASGNDNTAVGYKALYSNNGSTFNTANGFEALETSTGGYNTATGAQALTANSTGTNNTAMGFNALNANSSGGNNTAIGYGALQSSAGSNNTAIGYLALTSPTGGNNTAVGYYALPYGSSSETALGYYSGYYSTGGYNVCLGYEAGYTNTTGANNTFVGYDADATAGTYSNSTAIGNGSRITASNTVVLGNHSVTQTQFNGALMPYYGSAYNAGTTGQVLTSQGAAVAPQWTPATSVSGVLSIQDVTITGTNQTINANATVLNIAGSLTGTLTINLPLSPVNGQTWFVTAGGGVTAPNIVWNAPTGTSLSSGGAGVLVTSLTPGSWAAELIYDQNSTTWLNLPSN